MENIKWGRIVVWSIIGIVILVAAPILYVVARMVVLGFQMGGNPPPEMQREFASGTPIMVVLFVAAALVGAQGRGQLSAERDSGRRAHLGRLYRVQPDRRRV